MEVLVVCTANVCRSVMLQAFLQRHLDGDVSVETAGVLPGERAADDNTVAALRDFGVDVSEHASAHLDRESVHRADLILCLERRHVRDVAVVDRSALPRTFTVRELVRRGERIGPREPVESLESWLVRAGAGRDPSTLLEDSPDDDVADPTGGPLAAYEHTARWLEGLASRLVALVWPPSSIDAESAEASTPRAAFALASQTPELELWRHSNPNGVRPQVIGMAADRSGVRLARGVETVLQSLGYELYGLQRDAWVAPTWTWCAEHSSAALERGEVDAIVILTDSGTGPAALANRRPGVRAVAPADVSTTRRARRRWGANLLCLGVDEVTPAEAVEIVQAFINERAGVVDELDDGPPRPGSS